MLKIQNIGINFGGLRALDDVSFSVGEGEVVGLIGPNGAGKTTMMNIICGVYRPAEGKIFFEENEITRLSSDKICRFGISRTYQIPQPFYAMTALAGVVTAVLNGKKRPHMCFSDAGLEASYYLEFVGLFSKRDELASNLNLYELRMLELARALATTPKLLLLDEVMAGLNPVESERALEMIWSAQEQFGITLLWIEHVMKIIMKAAQRIVVLQYGKKIAEGPPEQIANDPRIIEAYLGGKH
ncbi:MAG: ABC transporter ATP-binding protein [delta proteobacterium MLS_D]|nr:MAG: ABC transporter ATP-binding protein [delta proteobacterium MLS_D]